MQISNVTVFGSSITIPEDIAVNTALAFVSATDVDVGQVLRCVASGNAAFQIINNSLVLVGALDFEAEQASQVIISCADNGLPNLSSRGTTFRISISDVNEAPQNIRYDLLL